MIKCFVQLRSLLAFIAYWVFILIHSFRFTWSNMKQKAKSARDWRVKVWAAGESARVTTASVGDNGDTGHNVVRGPALLQGSLGLGYDNARQIFASLCQSWEHLRQLWRPSPFETGGTSILTRNEHFIVDILFVKSNEPLVTWVKNVSNVLFLDESESGLLLSLWIVAKGKQTRSKKFE